MIDIEDVKRLTLGPKDILVVKVDGHLSTEMTARLKSQHLSGFPGLENKIMVLDRTTSLAIVEQESL
ncbi:hypothetical protein SAMN03159423_4865 [Bradyrhizobium sp. NFR13]|uniref:hypothetical protein n=1 Tax=Bradyrhizobium sp. NFR13 TaxID=1566285 RepID=UPI0008E528A7|nr:hypothetical protein [Bradyrhizobium sp. NFR13]SFM00560.1 hypothetical protein SAMN03159423_4865 [Bradyrhizobium sp. NFR13]